MQPHQRHAQIDRQPGIYVLLMHFAAAEIHEIWFAHAGREREHDWVGILAGLKGAEIPMTGFSSQDCQAGCHAHLLHFKQRPLAAVLRAELSRRHPSDSLLQVAFVEPSRLPADAAGSAPPRCKAIFEVGTIWKCAGITKIATDGRPARLRRSALLQRNAACALVA